MNIYPKSLDETKVLNDRTESICSSIYGNRFRLDQTLYEYLIEFLLIFTSPKSNDYTKGKMSFHNPNNADFDYWVEPRMGLRRFIFFDKSKKTRTIPADKDAYNEIRELLMKKLGETNEFDNETNANLINELQDLLHGYAVVVKNRNWCAQSVLPICSELVFCEAMPNEKVRKNSVDWSLDRSTIDTKFEFSQRNFLARGGEIYYLHLLQGLGDNENKKNTLERLLSDLTVKQCKKMSSIACFIQEEWYNDINMEDNDKFHKLSLSFIPENAYEGINEFACDELINYLSCKIHPINRVDVLAKGIVLQVMRMIYFATYRYLGIEPKKWIIDMRSSNSDSVKKIAASSFKTIENDFLTALNKKAEELEIHEGKERLEAVAKAKKHSYDLFKMRGKELQMIIPIRGGYERFTISEDIIRFLVLSIIKPKEKMTLDMFLEKLYEHYGMVIGPEQYKKTLGEDDNLNKALTNNFNDNLAQFQLFLKNTGFLRELSDATSIIENPYSKVEVE